MSGGEIILILAVALLLFGPKNLPDMARKWGHMMEQFRRAARDVQDEILRGPDPPRPVRPAESVNHPTPVDDDGVPQADAEDWIPPEATNGDGSAVPAGATEETPPPASATPPEDFKAHGDGI